ncbi:hypothetical protein CHLRE_08g373341v5 [Chlamydomonas reinhardtii]|uniref:Uncharacterized protein n=1 Tax=Chlamydomonas reinhardtii TaxID=3055 RepID=A0A2K3DHF2_CHLRE|nr:uncharacterized protein CHLRE_08g373341v5 [Chlamydomonas reinhardtii]PNW79946.1 hypothetical protein CHLRE_08g373341v5 [Chlamydomonas reinhardtii]
MVVYPCVRIGGGGRCRGEGVEAEGSEGNAGEESTVVEGITAFMHRFLSTSCCIDDGVCVVAY